MHRRTLALPALLLATALVALPVASAEEDAPWPRHELGDGPASITLPPTWTITRDPDGFWLYAQGPKDPAALFAWSRTPLESDATLGRFYERQLDAERGATIRKVGFRVDDIAYEPLAGKDAIWTLVQRPGAEPPTRSLYVHLRHAGQGHALRVDVRLGTFDRTRELTRRLLTTFDLGAGLDVERPHGKPREFQREIPEEIAFRGHPFLQTVERANEKRFFGPDEQEAYAAAGEAWEETVRHHRRLAQDRRYRTADRVFANLAHDPTLVGLSLTFHWMDPYVLCGVSAAPRPAAVVRSGLETRGQTLKTTYESVRSRYGDAVGLKDLMAPWGGRPDLGAHRSFEDGVPLVALVFESPSTWKRYHGLRGHRTPAVAPACHYDRVTGRLELIGAPSPSADGMGAAYQLLDWFSRQKNRWRASALPAPFLLDGLAAWLGSDGGASVAAAMRAMASALAAEERSYPVLDLRRLLSVRSHPALFSFLRSEHGLPPSTSRDLARHQAWAFLLFLEEGEDGRRRGRLSVLLDAVLRREGGSDDTVARVLGVQGDDGWASLETAYDTFVRERLLDRKPPALADESDIRIRLGPQRLAVLYLRAEAGRGAWFRLGSFDPSHEVSRGELASVLAWIARWRPEPTMVLLGDRKAQWDRVQEIMRIAARPDVGITRIQFQVTRERFGEDPDATPPEPVAVGIRMVPDGTTIVSFRGRANRDVLVPAEPEAHLRRAAAELGLAGSEQGVLLTLDRSVPWTAVRPVLEALRDVGGNPKVQIGVESRAP